MQVYFIRRIEEKTLVGIVWAEDPRELFMMIDEKDDPGKYECQVVEDSGGLFFDKDVAYRGPVVFTERLSYMVTGQEPGEFKPLSTFFKGGQR